MKLTNSFARGILVYIFFSFLLCVTFANAAGLININTANQAELTTLKGIGPVKAQAILDYRAAQPFYSVEDIKKVKGIGDATFAGIKDFITVGDIVAPVSVPKVTPAKSPAKNYSTATNTKTAAVTVSKTPLQSSAPENNLLWTGLALAALIVLGVGGVMYARASASVLINKNEGLTADEFEIVA